MRILLLGNLVVLASCSSKSLDEQFHSHPNYDISTMKTYAWEEPAVQVVGLLTGAENSELTRRARAAGETVLSNRGYVSSGPHRPDMLASVMIGAITQTSFSEHSVSGQGYFDREFSWSQENDYLRGGVSIILTHPDNGDIMWQGTVIDNLKNDNRRARGTINRFAEMIEQQLPLAR